MTLQLDAEVDRAVIHGPPRRVMDGSAPTVMENIARRVAEAPDGLMRSFQADGTLREQTFAEAWRRSGTSPPDCAASGSVPAARPCCCWAIFSTSSPVSGRRCAWARPRCLSPASPTPPRLKSSRTWPRASNVRRLSPTRPRPTSTGCRLCCPMRRSSAFRRSPAKPTKAKMKRWIPSARAGHRLSAPDLGLDRDGEVRDARPSGRPASLFLAELFAAVAEGPCPQRLPVRRRQRAARACSRIRQA